MNRDDQARAKRLNAALGSPTIGPPAPPPRQIKPRDVVLEHLEQLRARRLRALPVATRHDERQARAGVLDARLVRARARKERAGVVGAALQGAVQEAATDPEAYAAVRARRGEER